MLATHATTCPCCGEPITLTLDASAGAQTCIEDCAVCCRPITVILDIDDDGEPVVRLQSESDT
ncbi:MAG TPA: CPXCG motif-containing cysteine-rich protein [Lysobacter sp.]